MATIVTTDGKLFAGSLESLIERERKILVASAGSSDKLRGVLEATRLKKEEFKFNGTLYVIFFSSRLIYTPEESHSPGSKAIYLARGAGEDCREGFLIQFLPPYSVTSRHFHRREEETYYNLEGTCFLSVGEKEIILNQSTYSVKPLQIHQLRTEKWPALNLLWIKGNSVEGLEHFYV